MPGFAFSSHTTRTFSRGRVKLGSSDVRYQPIIDYQFSDPRDIEAIVSGLELADKIARTKALFHELGARPFQNNLPGCKELSYGTREFFECLVRTLGQNDSHQCCTNKMGPKSDPFAVLDPELRVYGVKKLRVVDTSVMPIIPSSNTHAPVVMVAEKAADLIKGKHRSE